MRPTATVMVLALTALRVALAPLLVLLARHGAGQPPSSSSAGGGVAIAGVAYVACCVAAFLSDVFDGVLARRWRVDGPTVRRLDSAADTVFYVAAAWSVWIARPDVVHDYARGALVVVALELLRYAVDYLKFGREASYHAWSAKAWGLSLFAALVATMGFGRPRGFVDAAVLLGVVADLEGLAMSLVLPRWTHDVRGIGAAAREAGKR
ncbi:MAG TPA: CDP-alcohol phosphatidyltransferase family protein [Gemmatimonadaceae bacterium]|nr:CDP-alcohol phosphatidyltransferase family protein [Gemmatimonadaceae bacterium]